MAIWEFDPFSAEGRKLATEAMFQQRRKEIEYALLYGYSNPSAYRTGRDASFGPSPELKTPEPPMPEELPKQDLLLKFLNMTTSSADGEALTAIRKANALLRSSGWSWDQLLAGKIKIIADPFSGLG